jgi:MFS superfamily sulfate permease-like transporter
MAAKQPARFPKLQPLAGLRGTRVADLPREIPAGITLAAMILPLNIGFAQLAGLPATAGLYAGIIPLVLFALFTSSRQVVASPDAPITALLAATLVAFAPVGDPLRLQYALAIAPGNRGVHQSGQEDPRGLPWGRRSRRGGSACHADA